MFQKARESAYLESTSLLFLLVRWRKPLIIIFLVSLLASIVFSGPNFIEPKYRSSVIFFPSATNSISKAILEETSSDKQDILAFGEEEQAEQMLQILNSDEIREEIIRKYNLLSHYDIKPDETYPQTKLIEEYKDNVSFSRTEFMSVRIDVLDKDPQVAANIANDIASLLDSMKTRIQRTRSKEAVSIVKNAYESKLVTIKQKEDSLKFIFEKGVLDFSSQTEILNKEYAQASSVYTNENANLEVIKKYKQKEDTAVINTEIRMIGAKARMANMQTQLKLLAKYGGANVSLNQELSLDREELSKIKKQYDKLSMDANQNLSTKFIVNNAVKAEKKCYPVRWLIVLVSVIITFILSVFTILIFEKVREIKYNL